MKARLGIDADPEKAASAGCKIVDGLVASGDGKAVGKGDSVGLDS